MKKQIILLALVMSAASGIAAAGESRTLTHTTAAGSISRLVLHSGIGDIDIDAALGATEITIEVVLTPRRGGFFSSKRKAEQEVQNAGLSADVANDRLKLAITPEADDDRRFEEDWHITLPSTVALKLNHGVGDISIRGAEAGIGIDSGVGEVGVKNAGGDISIELGVGTAVVHAQAAAYASAEAEAGVGDARLTVRGQKIASGGFVGHAANWEGDGTLHIEVSVGVGDAVIQLD